MMKTPMEDHLGKALESVRSANVDIAVQRAIVAVDQINGLLKANGNDRDAAAPEPAKRDPKYQEKSQLRATMMRLTTAKDSGDGKGQLDGLGKDIASLSTESVANFMIETKDAADQRYSAMIQEMTAEVGPLAMAEILGQAEETILLIITRHDGTAEEWAAVQTVSVTPDGKIEASWNTNRIEGKA
tara:strand:- start:988 stop:1545 length:558 start_codon:yes stop_codon:yes gene_type:complete